MPKQKKQSCKKGFLLTKKQYCKLYGYDYKTGKAINKKTGKKLKRR